jgi:hypothetical protein
MLHHHFKNDFAIKVNHNYWGQLNIVSFTLDKHQLNMNESKKKKIRQ